MKHWTEEEGSFAQFIVDDFIEMLEMPENTKPIFEEYLTSLLGPIVSLVRHTGKKATMLIYDDNDSENTRGPVFAEVFLKCWEAMGKPRDFKELKTACNKVVELVGGE